MSETQKAIAKWVRDSAFLDKEQLHDRLEQLLRRVVECLPYVNPRDEQFWDRDTTRAILAALERKKMSKTTDIWPAIRKEVEVLIDAYKTGDMDAPMYSPQKRAAARAALNKRVEEICSEVAYLSTDRRKKQLSCRNDMRAIRALLNKEPEQ